MNDGGYTVVGPFASCSAALAWLRDATPDLALLDLPAPSLSAHEGPHRAAQDANQKSSRVAQAIAQAAGELEQRLRAAALRLDGPH